MSPRPFLVRETAPDFGVEDDPLDDCDALETLEEEIVVLAVQIHAATYRLLTLIADFDRRRGWELGAHRSCAHWLHYRTGIDLGAAREKVRAARALADLPLTSAAMARGELSFSKIRALTRVASPENESDLLELARGCTTAQLERLIRAYRIGSRASEAELERRRHESRTFSVFPGDDGMYVVKGRLEPEVGALLMRAVEAAGDALYWEVGGPWEPEQERSKRAAQLRADAVGLLAERAMAVGFGGTGDEAEPPLSGTRAERYQVVLHSEEAALKEEGSPREEEAAGFEGTHAHLEDGTHVSAETSRRLACDAAIVRITHASDGSILNVGRRTRTIPPALRRALEARDGGCRFPGCGLRFCDAHHVKHWADGGETKLGNTLLLCRHHHRLIHEGGWRVMCQDNGLPAFIDPRGGFHFEGGWEWPEGVELEGEGSTDGREGTRPTAKTVQLKRSGPRPPASPTLLAALLAENARRGVRPDGWTGSARWKRREDIPAEVFFPAIEAIGEAGP